MSKKIQITSGIFIFSIALLFLYHYHNANQTVLAYNQSNLIRLHVVANSNSEADQVLKMKVRDVILQSMSPAFKRVNNVGEARTFLQANLGEIKNIAINQIPLVYFVIFLFSAFFGISLSYLLKCAYVEIVGDEISGRNYWLLKRQFPLNDIVKAYPFSSNGMPVVVVDAGKKGEIFIPVHIENSELLFGILDKYT